MRNRSSCVSPWNFYWGLWASYDYFWRPQRQAELSKPNFFNEIKVHILKKAAYLQLTVSVPCKAFNTEEYNWYDSRTLTEILLVQQKLWFFFLTYNCGLSSVMWIYHKYLKQEQNKIKKRYGYHCLLVILCISVFDSTCSFI